jgi:hypothetical protein
MNYRDLAGWPWPSRAAHHAAPFSRSTSARRQAHQALRLFVTAGTWAAGLCLVIGSIVLVASAAAPNRPGSHLSAAAEQAGLSASAQPARLQTAGHVITALAGRGDQVTKPFIVRTGDELKLWWSYSCPAGLPVDQLMVQDAVGKPAGHARAASINATAADGSGAISVSANPGRHYLVVTSTCSWQMKLVQSR